MVVTQPDEPGVIGFIGAVMGAYDGNIAGTFDAREAIGGEALTVYNVDGEVPEAAREELEADENSVGVRYIPVNGQS